MSEPPEGVCPYTHELTAADTVGLHLLEKVYTVYDGKELMIASFLDSLLRLCALKLDTPPSSYICNQAAWYTSEVKFGCMSETVLSIRKDHRKKTANYHTKSQADSMYMK